MNLDTREPLVDALGVLETAALLRELTDTGVERLSTFPLEDASLAE